MSTESRLTELLDATSDALVPVFDQMAWGEDEISKARQRHPHAADVLHHSFTLLCPTSDRMHTEFVYRGHCRELLDRLAHNEDTRPGTAAEVVISLCELAQATPLNATGYGLACRMWAAAFPDQQELDAHRQHRETLHGSSLDDAEADTRAKTAIPGRLLGPIKCTGGHHGQQVACTYAPQNLPVEGAA